MNKMFQRFESWWKDKGQYECAPVGNGPGDVKAQIMKAYNSGYLHGSHEAAKEWSKEAQEDGRNAYAQGRYDGEESGRVDGWI